MPPRENDRLENGSSSLSLNVSRGEDKLLFQCAAESNGQTIFSDAAKLSSQCKYKVLLLKMLLVH